MYYSAIKPYDIANGPGLRVSLFVSGCYIHCKGCFNPEAQNFTYGKFWDDKALTEITQWIDNPHIVGLSILGGDPLCQSIEDMFRLIYLARYTHSQHKTIWIWSGFTWEHIFTPFDFSVDNTLETDYLQKCQQILIKECDVWVDGPFIEKERDLRLQYCGSRNQRVLDVKKSLENKAPVLFSIDN